MKGREQLKENIFSNLVSYARSKGSSITMDEMNEIISSNIATEHIAEVIELLEDEGIIVVDRETEKNIQKEIDEFSLYEDDYVENYEDAEKVDYLFDNEDDIPIADKSPVEMAFDAIKIKPQLQKEKTPKENEIK